MFTDLFLCLSLTIIAELYLFSCIFYLMNNRIYKYEWLTCILVNIITNPVLNVLIILFQITNVYIIVMLECLVVYTEAILYHKFLNMDINVCLGLSFFLNLFSYVMGQIIL